MIEILWVMHYDTEHRNESQTTRLSIPCDTTLSASRIFSIFSILLFSSSGKLRVIKRMINEGKSRELLMKSLVYSQLYREEEEWKRRNKTDTVYLLVFHVLVFMLKIICRNFRPTEINGKEEMNDWILYCISCKAAKSEWIQQHFL